MQTWTLKGKGEKTGAGGGGDEKGYGKVVDICYFSSFL